MVSVSEITIETFLKEWNPEDFFHESIFLSEKAPFYKIYCGNKLIFLKLFFKQKFAGFSIFLRESKGGICKIQTIRSPYVTKDFPCEDFKKILQGFYRSIPGRNFIVSSGVPDYFDKRLPFVLRDFCGNVWGTYCMDFHHENREVLSNVASKYLRRDIRRALQDETLSFAIVEPDDVELLKDALMLKSEVKKKTLDSKKYQNLLNAGKIYNCYRLFLVYYSGIPVAQCALAYGKDFAFEEGLAVSEEAKEKSPYAGIFLKYKMMQWALEKGIKTYDLMGFNPHPKNSKEEAIASFKKKFSNREIIYPVYSSARGLGQVVKVAKDLRDCFGKKTT